MLDDDEVIALSKAYAEERGWIIVEPIVIEEGKLIFGFGGKPRVVKVLTNGGMPGTSAWFEVDREKGEVLAGGYVPY